MTVIELARVSIRLGDASIVDDVDLAIPGGSFVAIVGPNGSGKTTLLRGMYQAVRPSGGAICIGGVDTTGIVARAAARLRAVVPQFQDADVPLTAAEIVATGTHAHAPWWAVRRADERASVITALRRADAEVLADRAFGTLSGGERQRVLLARALAQDAQTLLLDEPTNHLDARSQLALLDVLADLDVTRVAVLHDLDHALAYADRIAVVHAGKLVAYGAPVEVLTDALTTEVFGVRSQIIEHPLTGRPHIVTARA